MSTSFDETTADETENFVGEPVSLDSLDAPAAEEEVIDLDDDGDEESSSAAGGKTSTAKRAGIDRALVRRIATKADDVATAPEKVRNFAATLLNSPTSTVDLTVAIMAADRSAQAPLHDLKTLVAQAEEDPIDTMVAILAFSKERVKSIYSLLGQLDAPGANAPLNQVAGKAAKQVLGCLTLVEEETLSVIDDVLDLLRKAPKK